MTFSTTGQLVGNTQIPIVSAPSIHGSIPADSSGNFVLMSALASTTMHLSISTDQGVNVDISFPSTDTLATIVSAINSETLNAASNYVVASIHDSALLLTSTSSGEGSWIQVNAYNTVVPNVAAGPYLGIHQYPHSKGRVTAGSLSGTATNNTVEGNIEGTAFLGQGEDRSSSNYNRALAHVSTNTDVNNKAVTRPTVTFVDIRIPAGSARLVDDGSGNIESISLDPDTPAGDSVSVALANSRVYVGDLTSTSRIYEIASRFKIAGKRKINLTGSDGREVYVVGVVSGSFVGTVLSYTDRESAARTALTDAVDELDGGNILGVSVTKDYSGNTNTISKFIDNSTIECSGSDFSASGDKVLVGDVVTISGSASSSPFSNDGTYTVVNVVSSTILEVASSEREMNMLNTTNPGGTLVVSTGDWAVFPTLLLSPSIPYPTEDIVITIPIETTVADMSPAGGITPEHRVRQLPPTLNRAYEGGGTAAGSGIRTVRPLSIETGTAPSSYTVIDATLVVEVLSNNTIELDTASTVTRDVVGDVIELLPVYNSNAKTSLMVGELVLIEEYITRRKVKVRPLSRTGDLPTQSGVSARLLNHELLPEHESSVVTSTTNSVGGRTLLLNSDDGIHSDITLEPILVRDLANALPKYIPCTLSSPNYIDFTDSSDSGVLNTYALSGGGANIILRILTGRNAGFYRVLTITGSPCRVTLQSIDGQSVSFTASTEMFAELYTVSGSGVKYVAPQGTIHSSSHVESHGAMKVAKSVHWTGTGNGVSVESNNASTADDVYRGLSALGSNIYSYSGPGAGGVSATSVGYRAYDQTLLSADALYVPSTDYMIGRPAVSGTSTTHHVDADDRPDGNLRLKGGGGLFISTTDDPALTGSYDYFTLIPKEKPMVGAIVASGRSGSTEGALNNALAVHGNVYCRSVNDSGDIWYTESNIHARSLMPSHTLSPNSSSNIITENSKIGDNKILARVSGSEWIRQSKMRTPDYAMFNIPHLFVIRINNSNSFTNSFRYNNIDLVDARDSIGCTVFFLDTGVGPYNDIVAATGASTVNLPFAFKDDETTLGLEFGLKVIAAYTDASGDQFLCLGRETWAQSIGTPSVSNGVFADVDIIIYAGAFTIAGDLKTPMVINPSTDALEVYDYTGTASDSHTKVMLHDKSPESPVVGEQGDSSILLATRITQSNVLPTHRASLLHGAEDWSTPVLSEWGDNVTPMGEVISFADKGANGFFTHGDTQTAGAGTLTSNGIMMIESGTGSDSASVVGPNGKAPGSLLSEGYTPYTNAFDQEDNTNFFKGGGRKLVVHSRSFSDPTTISYGTSLRTISLRIDPAAISKKFGFNLNIIAASFTNATSADIAATLYVDGVAVANKVLTYDATLNIVYRTYQNLQVQFARSELAGVALDNIGTSKVHIELGFRTAAQWVYHNMAGTSQQQRLVAARALGYKYTAASMQSGTYDAGKFPDAWFIADISVVQDTETLGIAGALSVAGELTAKTLRYESMITGYATVGPASVDLLQNSEYGTGQGGEYSNVLTNISPVIPSNISVISSNDDKVNLEGRDVGLLPMWHTAPILEWAGGVAPVAATAGGMYSLTSAIDGFASAADVITWSDSTTRTAHYVLSRVNPTWVASLPLNAGASNAGSPYTIDTAMIGFKTGTLSGARVLVYRGVLTFTKFYRPIFDRGAFFRKGVHSAAIHGFHPFFDPMYYWYHAASAITAGKLNAEILVGTGSTFDAGIDSGLHQELGSYRHSVGSGAPLAIEACKVNPNAVKLPGMTGFIVPLDSVPHGSLLTQLDLNISIRPSYTRSAAGSNAVGGAFEADWGIWNGLPDKTSSTATDCVEFQDGAYWLSKGNSTSGWQEKEGYVVKLWRHSLFDDGMGMGSPDIGSTYNTSGTIEGSAVNKVSEGNATLLYKEVVDIRASYTGKRDGACGEPIDYVRTAVIDEATSRLSIILDSNSSNNDPRFRVDRANYSYFVTVEFHIGIRKPIVRNTVAGYCIPGLDNSVDSYNRNHLPYMWTPAFQGVAPTGMSSIHGNDRAVSWQGFLVPHGKVTSPELLPQSVHRGHPANYVAEDDAGVASTTDATSEFNAVDTTVSFTGVTAESGVDAKAFMNEAVGREVPIPNHQIWYPVVKFRGLRATYLTERPGHGGW